MQRYATIITQGDELTTGSVLNTNAQWLAEQLTNHGWTVQAMITAPDDPKQLIKRFKAEAIHSELIISSGGLGPTSDDHTRQAFSLAFDIPLIENPLARHHIQAYCHRRKRIFTEDLSVMALLPTQSTLIPNEHGSAVGFEAHIHQCRFYALPGVPSELKPMFLNSILPSLTKGDIHLQKTFLCFGEPEAALQKRLNAVDLSSYTIGYRATRAGNLLKLYGPPLSNDLLTDLRHRLYDCCLAEDEQDMAAAIGAQLRQDRETIATAESCTAGRVSSWLASIPGASAYLLEGVVVYSNEAKQKYTGVRTETLQAYGAVSRQTAIELAQGIRDRAKSTWGLSVTGIAGPGGGSPQKPVGTVHIAVAGPNDTLKHRQLQLHGPRGEITLSSAAHLLFLLHEARREKH